MSETRTPPAPKKLSEAIGIALADLEKVGADDRYTVDMAFYHTPLFSDNKCHVCFAGVVMACSLSASPADDPSLEEWGYEWRNVFWALDEVRTGSVGHALEAMDICCSHDLDRPVAAHHIDPTQFKADMRAIQQDLEKEGL